MSEALPASVGCRAVVVTAAAGASAAPGTFSAAAVTRVGDRDRMVAVALGSVASTGAGSS